MKDNKRPSDLELERFLLGELPSQQMERIRSLSATDPELEQRLVTLRQSNQDFKEMFPASREVNIIRNKIHKAEVEEKFSRQTQARLPRFKALPAALATGIALMAAFALLLPQINPNSPDNQTRLKGAEPKLKVFLNKKSGPVQLKDGQLLRQGDILQLEYLAAGYPYGIIFSRDGKGQVTLHFPESKEAPPRLEKGGAHLLPYAYELDDAPDFENFYFIASTQELDVPKILDAFSSQGVSLFKASQAKNWKVYSLNLNKEN